jgi:hypothetical protein
VFGLFCHHQNEVNVNEERQEGEEKWEEEEEICYSSLIF